MTHDLTPWHELGPAVKSAVLSLLRAHQLGDLADLLQGRESTYPSRPQHERTEIERGLSAHRDDPAMRAIREVLRSPLRPDAYRAEPEQEGNGRSRPRRDGSMKATDLLRRRIETYRACPVETSAAQDTARYDMALQLSRVGVLRLQAARQHGRTILRPTIIHRGARWSLRALLSRTTYASAQRAWEAIPALVTRTDKRIYSETDVPSSGAAVLLALGVATEHHEGAAMRWRRDPGTLEEAFIARFPQLPPTKDLP